MTAAVVYRFHDATGALLYIGTSASVGQRCAEHGSDKPWFTQVANVRLQHFPDRATALAAEAHAIRDERPRYNRNHQAPVNAGGRQRGLTLNPVTFDALTHGQRRQDVAARLGVAPSTLSELARGKARASAERADRIAAALGVDRADLFSKAAA